MELEDLEKKSEDLADKINEGLDVYVDQFKDDPNMIFKAFEDYYKLDNVKAMVKERGETIFEIKKKKEIVWEDIPEYGDLMPIKEWIACVKCGGFIDYDGYGNYATKDKVSNITVSPSNYKNGWMLKNKEFTHIVWYNR